MRSWLFNMLVVVSLLLCLATVGLWRRSHSYEDYWEVWAKPNRSVGLGSSNGQVWAFYPPGRTMPWEIARRTYDRWFLVFSVTHWASIPEGGGSYHIPLKDRWLYDVVWGGDRVEAPHWF